MNFYASREYLETISSVYFRGETTRIEEVQVGHQTLRLLVVGRRRVITEWFFLDYHEPLKPSEVQGATRKVSCVPAVAQNVMTYDEWKALPPGHGLMPAPYVDWSPFKTYDDYQNHIKPRGKDLLREAARRRRRLADELGTLEFTMDDTRPDVIPTAIQWKSQQLRDTHFTDIFQRAENTEFFHELRRRGHLVASTLRAKERLLSMWLGFVHDGVWSGWIFAYDHDPALKKYSLGRQLLHSMLEEGYRRKHKQFDFSIGDEEYKWLYATHVRICSTLGKPSLEQQLLRRARDKGKLFLERYPTVYAKAKDAWRVLRNRSLLHR